MNIIIIIIIITAFSCIIYYLYVKRHQSCAHCCCHRPWKQPYIVVLSSCYNTRIDSMQRGLTGFTSSPRAPRIHLSSVSAPTQARRLFCWQDMTRHTKEGLVASSFGSIVHYRPSGRSRPDKTCEPYASA